MKEFLDQVEKIEKRNSQEIEIKELKEKLKNRKAAYLFMSILSIFINMVGVVVLLVGMAECSKNVPLVVLGILLIVLGTNAWLFHPFSGVINRMPKEYYILTLPIKAIA